MSIYLSLMDLKTWREKSGITQVELAIRLGIKQPHLSLLERKLTGASLDLALRIQSVSDGAVSLETLTKPEAP